MDLELKGRIAIVTGASSGIGREIARVLAGEGVRTIIVARRAHLLNELADEIVRGGGIRPVVITADLYDRASPVKIRDQVLKEFGHIDILVNDAGGSRGTMIDAPDEFWDESFALNFTAVRKLTQSFLPCMQERKWGRIINITGGKEPHGGVSASNAAKAAVHAWTKGLSRDVGKFGININCIGPGRIHSEQIDKRMYPTPESQANFSKGIPVGYFGDPCDVAYMVAFLCSPKARYITGEHLYIDGGLHRAM